MHSVSVQVNLNPTQLIEVWSHKGPASCILVTRWHYSIILSRQTTLREHEIDGLQF